MHSRNLRPHPKNFPKIFIVAPSFNYQCHFLNCCISLLLNNDTKMHISYQSGHNELKLYLVRTFKIKLENYTLKMNLLGVIN